MGLKVCKFGGTSLATAEAIHHVCDIIRADPDRRIIALSAPGKRAKSDTKVTDLLIACARERL
ncbi:MAG: aspartate kinase, partial [bacterium]|nr:aspartate kinase [bacterium]